MGKWASNKKSFLRHWYIFWLRIANFFFTQFKSSAPVLRFWLFVVTVHSLLQRHSVVSSHASKFFSQKRAFPICLKHFSFHSARWISNLWIVKRKKIHIFYSEKKRQSRRLEHTRSIGYSPRPRTCALVPKVAFLCCCFVVGCCWGLSAVLFRPTSFCLLSIFLHIF